MRLMMFFGLYTCLLGWGQVLFAEPPYMAIETLRNISFPQSSCADVAEQVLHHDGFAKIKKYGGSQTLFAAYRESKDYGFKASVKCLPAEGAVIITVVADNLKQIKSKAVSLAVKIRRHGSPGEEEQPFIQSGNPDCHDGPTLMRCLNSIPPDDVQTVINHLQKQGDGG